MASGSGDDDEPAGDLELEGPRDGADGREQHDGGEEDPPELLGADPEEALLVAAGDEHRADPDQRQQQRHPDGGRLPGPAGLGRTEADQVAGERSARGTERVAEHVRRT